MTSVQQEGVHSAAYGIEPEQVVHGKSSTRMKAGAAFYPAKIVLPPFRRQKTPLPYTILIPIVAALEAKTRLPFPNRDKDSVDDL